jgi:hypothetical protein
LLKIVTSILLYYIYIHRAVYLEGEFWNLVQGDMDIAQYTGRLKTLADALRDVGQPVGETRQVLNMLRGISSKHPRRRLTC